MRLYFNSDCRAASSYILKKGQITEPVRLRAVSAVYAGRMQIPILYSVGRTRYRLEWHLPQPWRLEISLKKLDKPSFYRRDASCFAKRHINSAPKVSGKLSVAFTNNQAA